MKASVPFVIRGGVMGSVKTDGIVSFDGVEVKIVAGSEQGFSSQDAELWKNAVLT
jgi:hypothetical protein